MKPINGRDFFWIQVLALHCSTETVGRLTKRNGYTTYQTLAGHSHNSGALFQPQQDPHSAPDHEAATGGISATVDNKYDNSYYEYKITSSNNAAGHGENSAPYHLASEPPSSGHKSGYSIGSGLRSIAQGSANQAYSAVASQHAAAKQAAFLAKNSLAQAASQAAATAQAALEGKQVLLQELQHQAGNAQKALSRELEQLQAAKIAAKLAQQTAQAAHNHVSVLTAALNNAKSVAEHADQASQEVSNQLASQSAMVGQAKTRLDQVEEQLKQASIDYEATKEATLKASSAAAEAQVNASKAAAHATLELHDSVNNTSEDDSYEDAQPFEHSQHGGQPNRPKKSKRSYKTEHY